MDLNFAMNSSFIEREDTHIVIYVIKNKPLSAL